MDGDRTPLTGGERGGDGGRLAANIVHFGRALRAAGLPVGPGHIIDAMQAVRTVGIGSRRDFYWTLHAVFVSRRDQREIFDQAFHCFWRNPQFLERMIGLLLPELDVGQQEPASAVSRRVAEALGRGVDDPEKPPKEERLELDATLTFSASESLQEMDFDSMSAEETAAALAAIRQMRLSIMEVPTRRFHPDPHGPRIDMRSTLRASLRSGGRDIPLSRRRRRTRHPPLVILCDISGSMSRYSRMLVHFMHALTNDRDRVHTFLFGTRLTNVTRQLRNRDVDIALTQIGTMVQDWSGGTRIGACLARFNRVWSRRVLAQGAVVILISDGLDRDAGEGLAREAERLHKSSRRVIWLNPLLRYEGFAPKSLGIRALLPHVDEFRSAHNLKSLSELAVALSHPISHRQDGMPARAA